MEQTERQCGSCTMCCKLLDVKGLTERNSWCKQCDIGKGCKKYEELETFSPACNSFQCVWKMAGAMPEELRPDKSRCIVTPPAHGDDQYTDLLIHVPPDRPDAWNKGEFGRWLKAACGEGLGAIISVGDERIAVGRSSLAVVEATHDRNDYILLEHGAPELLEQAKAYLAGEELKEQEDVIAFFQAIVDTPIAWKLTGRLRQDLEFWAASGELEIGEGEQLPELGDEVKLQLNMD